MTEIVCATRAGEGSRAVQLAAIKKAKESGQELAFLYIVDSAIYESIDEPLQPFVRVELYWLGNTLLRIAENRAHSAGLNPELIIREGRVQDEISKYVASVGASTLFLGAPRLRKTNIFDETAIENFAWTIHQTTGVHVQIIRPVVTASVTTHNPPADTNVNL